MTPEQADIIRRDWLFPSCANDHQWVFVGGRPCGCEPGGCSFPVHKCAVCGDYDYGENEEATEIRKRCEEREDRP